MKEVFINIKKGTFLLFLICTVAFFVYVLMFYPIQDYHKGLIKREYETMYLIEYDKNTFTQGSHVQISIDGEIQNYTLKYQLQDSHIKITSPELLVKLKEKNIFEIQCTYSSDFTTFLKYILKYIFYKSL